MADFKTLYPATTEDTVDLTITLASLATSATLLVGRESTAVNNDTTLDLDHLLTGKITVGTTPTIDTRIEIWAYQAIDISSGTPEYPDVLDGTDSAETIISDGVKFSGLVLAHTIIVDATTSDRTYPITAISIASIWGELPPFWGVFVTHNTGVNLNATGSNHRLTFHRIQKQSV